MQKRYLLRSMVLNCIHWYQRILSPDHSWLAKFTVYGCRFRPTCSEYSYQAIERYGILKGMWLGCKRILRCNPLTKGGYDPIP